MAVSTPCVIWAKARRWDGRGQMWHNGQMRVASRVICERVNGPPPTPKHEAAHLCHNGSGGCVAEDHLQWMTPAENRASQPGINRRGRKLAADQVRGIRAAMLAGERIPQIASRYGVSPRTVRAIAKNETWWWVP